MGEFLKDNYFTLVRVILMITFSIYGIMFMGDKQTGTGVSVQVLLLVSFYITAMAIKEIVGKKWRFFFYFVAAVLLCALYRVGGSGYILLVYFMIYELLLLIEVKVIWFIVPFFAVFINTSVGFTTQFLVITILCLFYTQYKFIFLYYKNQMLEETKTQQGLKRDIEKREYATRVELKKNMLESENRVLEERAQLSQTLHDKLGHNINGSIYQLEASKVVMEKDPEKARGMIQAVIDQLRTGMDEIRAILRKERPDKKQMALLQLYELCEDCNKKGVEAELTNEGDLTKITGEVWEVILDNAFEAVTNSMKYSKCKNINIKITVLNKMVKCIISDDGIGCDKIEDGMGISGMRQRTRAAGGTISFESRDESGMNTTNPGFTVNMLLPL